MIKKTLFTIDYYLKENFINQSEIDKICDSIDKKSLIDYDYIKGNAKTSIGVSQNQLLDLSIADYNNEVMVNDQINQSLLLMARGRGERLKGDLTARAEYMKAAGSLLTMGYKSNQAGSLVIV